MADGNSLRSWRWNVQRWWLTGGAQMVAVGAAAPLFVIAVWLAHAAWQTRAARDALESQLTTLRSASPIALPTEPQRQADFTTRLPSVVDTAQALEVVQDAAARAGVVVVSAQVQDSAPTPERLGRVELTILARGNYANVKQWLSEIATRLPMSTVPRLQLQRSEASPEVEARVGVTLWSQAALPSLQPERR